MKPKDPMKRYIITASGRKVYPLDMYPEDVSIEDVTHHLSNICRFTGATSDFYSVAQHSVLVSEVLDGTGFEMWGLLHDASEAYLMDLAGPLKSHEVFDGYREVEAHVMSVVAEAFGLGEQPPEVHAADMILLATEKRDLMPPDTELWHGLEGILPLDNRVVPWTPLKARRVFAQRYATLVHRMARVAATADVEA